MEFRLKIFWTRNSVSQDQCNGDGAQKVSCEGACHVCGDKTYYAFVRRRAACLVAACAPRLGANTFRLVARMRCGGALFRALKFYKNAAPLNFKILAGRV